MAVVALAQSPAADTVVVVDNPHRIIITEQPGGSMGVEVQGSGSNDSFIYRYSAKQTPKADGDDDDNLSIPFLSSLTGKELKPASKPSVEWFTAFGMHYGFMNMSGVGDMCNMGSSVELGLLCPISLSVIFPHSWRITTGVGFGWKNYRLNFDRCFTKDADGRLTLGTYDPDTYSHLSRLKIFYLDVPLLLRKAWGDFSLSAGAVLCFNVHGTALTRYREGEREIRWCQGGIGQHKVSLDLMAAAQFNEIGLYVKYNPCHVLKTGNIPEFRSFSIGFSLGL